MNVSASERGATIIIGRHCEYDWDTDGLTEASVNTLAQSALDLGSIGLKPNIILTGTGPTHTSTGWLLKQFMSPGDLNAIPMHTIGALSSRDWMGSQDSNYAILSKCLRIGAAHEICAIITTKEAMHRLIFSMASTIFRRSGFDETNEDYKDFGRFVAISYKVPRLGDLHPVKMIYEQKLFLQHIAPVSQLASAERKEGDMPFVFVDRRIGSTLQLSG